MSFVDPYNSMQVCVRHCPSKDITTWQEARDFAIHNNSRLCRYDVDPKDYGDENWSSAVGPCPKLPILKRYNSVLTSLLTTLWSNQFDVCVCLYLKCC